MDHLFLYSILTGIAIVLVLFVTRVALRWAIRLAIVGSIVLLVIGGIAWWWFSQPDRQPQTSPRSTSTRRSTSDRR